MPRPEQTPAPQFKGLPYGFNDQANAMSETVAQQEDFPAFAAPDDSQTAGSEPDFQPAGDEEAFLFGATDRPDEPVTSGVPFGPGADFSRYSYESDNEFLARVSKQLESNPSKDVQEFRRLIAKGL